MKRSALSASTWAAMLSVLACVLGGASCSDQTNDTGVASTHHDGGGSTSDDDGGGDPGDGDGGSITGDGGAGFSSALSVIVEPSDNGDALLNAIKAAKTSIHMTMYLLTDNDITNALANQKTANNLDVKVVLNETFPSGQGNTNLSDYNTLHGANASMVVWASNKFTYTHEKCIIIDGKTAWIMTMNASTSAPTSNREFLMVDSDPDDVAEAEAIFEADFAHTDITPSGKLLVAPDNDKDRIRALIGSATKTLDFELEELSDYDVVNDIAALADANSSLAVRIVLSDITPSSAQSSAVSKLGSRSNIKLVTTHEPYIHAKAIIVDGTRMYVGSANLTQNSMENNRELGLVTQTASVISPVQAAINTDFSAGTAL